MRLLLALVTLGLLFAGCVTPASTDAPLSPGAAGADVVGLTGVAHDAAGNVLDAAAAGMPLARGAQFSLPAGATEPTIGANKDGVFMTGFRKASFPNGGSTLYATFDKGQTMKMVGPTLPTGHSPAPISFDPMLYVDEGTNRVFMDDIWPLSCGTMSWSDDSGKTWTTNPVACGNPQVNDHQTIGTAKPRVLTTVGYSKVVYRCTNNVAYAACAVSLNGGLLFSPQIPVYTAKDGCTGITGHFQSDHEGRVFLASSACLPEIGGAGPTLFMSDNDGLTWTKTLIAKDADATPHDVDLAVDEANNVYALWTSKGLPVMAVSSDHGKTWSAPRVVSAPGVTATMFGTIVGGAVGHVAFAYVGSTIEGGYEGKPLGTGGPVGDIVGEPDPKEWDAATWNGYIGVMTNALDPNAPIQSVTANDPADPLARGLCGSTRCHGMNDFIDIVLDPEGRPWAAFVDVCTQKCVTDPKVHYDNDVGFMGTLLEGPALRVAATTLAPILPPPVKSDA